MSEFDPYKSWLDIENKTASTTYYKLLGLPEFEDDKDRIIAAADKAIRKIRSNKPGEHLAEWQKILDELQEIKVLLLDDRKKDAYDDDLRFADEFVRELEGGIKRDSAAAAVAKSAAPKKTESRPVKHDPKYPPGMTPKAPAPPPPPKPTMDDIELKVSPGPKPIDRKDSPFYPPMRSVDKAKPPAPEATPGPQPGLPLESAQAEQDSVLRDLMPPGTYPPPPLTTPAPSSPAAEMSPSYPPQPAAQPAPYQPQPIAPQQSPYAPAPAPMAQTGAFPPNPYAPQPAAYPQSYYPQAGHPPMAGLPMHAQPAYGQPHPMQSMPQPGYGYGAPMAQPMGYGGMTPGYGGMPPMAAPMYGAPMAMPMQPQAYMSPPAPAALDPMAPVAIPGMAVTSAPTAAPMAMPYGGAQVPSSVMMPPTPAAAIPVGTAMSSSAAAPPDAPAPATLADEPAKGIRSSSATSVMLAAKREKSSQQTLMFVGIGGLLLVVVSVVGFIAASGQFGGTPVANVPPEKGNINSANEPGKAPAVTVSPISIRPAIPPVTPEPVKPEPAKPKPPETKPEIKPEPPKPEVPKPEPPKPEPVKPEPPKPEPPKPELPKPVPMPVPPVEMPTKAEVIELAKALKDAKDAIGEFNFLESGADLAKADKLAKLPEHREKLARLKEVEGYVKQFHERLVQSATEMFERGAESFKVGSSTIVGMVEADTKRVILRVAGQNKTYQYSDMPVGLAAALADMKLEGSDPVSRVVKGAYVACHRSSSPDQLKTAKTWWEEATLGGADVSHLMPFLTDSYDLTKDLEKLPKSDAAQPAEAKGTKPATKGAPDIKALLEGKTP